MKGVVCSKCEDEEDGEPVYQGIHEIKKDQDEEMRKLKVNLMLGLLPCSKTKLRARFHATPPLLPPTS